MANAEELLVQIDASTEQLRREFRRAEDSTGKFQRQMDRKLSDVDRKINQFTQRAQKAMGAFGAAAGVAAGATGLGLLVKRAGETATQIQSLSRQAGTGTTQFQRLSAVFREANVSQQTLADGLREANLRLDEFVKTGKGSGAEAFQRLGIEADQANRFINDSEGLLLTVMERVRELESQAARTRVLDEIFGGEAGERFIQVLQQSQEEIRNTIQEAERMGLIIPERAIRRGDELNQKMRTLGRVLEANVTEAVARLGPQITEFLDEIIARLPEAADGAERFAKTLGLIDNLSTSARVDEIKDRIAELRTEAKRLEEQGGIIFGGAGGLDLGAFATAGDFAAAARKEIAGLRKEMAVLEAPTLDAASAGDTLSNRLADLNPHLTRTLEVTPEMEEAARDAAQGMGAFGGEVQELNPSLSDAIERVAVQ